MLRSLVDSIGVPTVIALTLGGGILLVWAGTLGGPVGDLVAIVIGLGVVLAGLGLLYAIWLKRLNADIGRNRHRIERQLEEILDDRE